MAVFSDDPVGGLVDHGIYFVIPRLGAVVGVRYIGIMSGVDFVHQEVDFRRIELAAGDAVHVIDDIASHRINLIKLLKISSSKPAGALVADIDAVLARDFQGQVMGRFAGVVAVCTGAFHHPIEAGGAGFFLKDAFGKGAPTDIAKANH